MMYAVCVSGTEHRNCARVRSPPTPLEGGYASSKTTIGHILFRAVGDDRAKIQGLVGFHARWRRIDDVNGRDCECGVYHRQFHRYHGNPSASKFIAPVESFWLSLSWWDFRFGLRCCEPGTILVCLWNWPSFLGTRSKHSRRDSFGRHTEDRAVDILATNVALLAAGSRLS